MHLTQKIKSQFEDLYSPLVGAICFNSTKQRFVDRSTTEAEYITLSMASRQAIWTRRVLLSNEDTVEELTALLLFRDNKASLQLSKRVLNTLKIKHIDTSFYHVTDKVEKESIKLFWIFEEEMLADGFTKPLSRFALEDKRARIGVDDVGRDN